MTLNRGSKDLCYVGTLKLAIEMWDIAINVNLFSQRLLGYSDSLTIYVSVFLRWGPPLKQQRKNIARKMIRWGPLTVLRFPFWAWEGDWLVMVNRKGKWLVVVAQPGGSCAVGKEHWASLEIQSPGKGQGLRSLTGLSDISEKMGMDLHLEKQQSFLYTNWFTSFHSL